MVGLLKLRQIISSEGGVVLQADLELVLPRHGAPLRTAVLSQGQCHNTSRQRDDVNDANDMN
jgi:hypothetical protein